jgi:hypothetical protein
MWLHIVTATSMKLTPSGIERRVVSLKYIVLMTEAVHASETSVYLKEVVQKAVIYKLARCSRSEFTC